MASSEKLFLKLLANGAKTYTAPRVKREKLPHFGVRVRPSIRNNVHKTAAALGMKADEMVEKLFATPHACN